MRIKYSKEDIEEIYNKTVEKAISFFQRNKKRRAVDCIKAASMLQYHLNTRFTDERMNSLLREIAFKEFNTINSYSPKENVVFFYDAFGKDNKGLTQQYLDALLNLNNKIQLVYIIETSFSDASNSIQKMLRDTDTITIELGNMDVFERVKMIQQLIIQYSPKSCLFHLDPARSLAPLMAFYPFKQIIKYQINLTDHAFWIGGCDFFNYIFEFREYGVSISLKERYFQPKQILYLPFYPWMEQTPFGGLPQIVNDKTIIFSGGAFYKIYDKEDVFLNLAKDIIEEDINSVFVYAGTGNPTHFYQFVKEHKLEERFVYIGNRTDIYEVMKKIDIYLGTYPMAGGLMTQLAAICGKPILAYKNMAVEDFVNLQEGDHVVYQSKDELLKEAKHLLESKEYRCERGQYLSGRVNDKYKFRNAFSVLYNNHINTQIVNHINRDYSTFYKSYLYRINANEFGGYLEALLIKASHLLYSYKVIINLILNINSIIKIKRNKR